MGYISANYKKAIFDELVYNVTANVSQYYAFASNPIAYTNGTPTVATDNYDTTFTNDWQFIFGKKLANSNFAPIILNSIWSPNTYYTQYDNTNVNLANSQYYVITPPSIVGGDYLIFKCINNANGGPSTRQPDQLQANTFYKSDGYGWRYISSISNENYNNFATNQYAPVYANTLISSSASNNAGIDVVVVSNGGIGYSTYHQGYVQFANSSVIQIQQNAYSVSTYYNNNSIYVYNNNSPTSSQLFYIQNYVSNSSGNWVYTNSAPNTVNITPSQSQYIISPSVVFDTDGSIDPSAYSVINTTSNSISQIVVVNPGVNISRANVSIVSNSHYGVGANAYAIVPPAGGHGSNPAAELNMKGYAISFNFINSESNTIPTNVLYNKIGIIKNPNVLNANGSKSSVNFSSNTFNQLLYANVSSAITFPVGSQVEGVTSSSLGTVAFSNSSVIYLTGDKFFVNNETIVSTTNSSLTTSIAINSGQGQIYARDIIPLYYQNISNVNRANAQTEAFKLIIQI